jgi:glucose-6-phosphate isomerase
MPLENINPTTTLAWKKLSEHYTKTKELQLKTLFEADPQGPIGLPNNGSNFW